MAGRENIFAAFDRRPMHPRLLYMAKPRSTLVGMDDLRIESWPGSRDGIRVLKLIGPFTLKHVFEFQTLVRQDPAPLTIIDLTAVPYMDSAALGSILGVHVSCQRHGVQYALAGASDRLKTLFKVAGVECLLVSCPSVAEAEGKLARTASA
jgi:anti-anti-sigma factor